MLKYILTASFVINFLTPVNLEKYSVFVLTVPNKKVRSLPEDSSYQWPLNIKKADVLLNTQFQDEYRQVYNDRNRNFNVARDADLIVDEDEFGHNKIVGGTEVRSINLYPYHIGYGNNCAGAIIDKNWAITAGHCGKKPYIRVGSKYLGKGKRITVKKNYIHPQWSAQNKQHPFDYDFQVLELDEPLEFDETVQPIKLARIEDMMVGTVITVTGWGNIVENGPYSNVLRVVQVPIITKDNCQNVPFPYFKGSLTSRMFCAGFSRGLKDACQGDSGGPAVAGQRLMGLVSFGYGCATPGAYGVYSKVALARDWIESVTGLKLD